MRVGMRSRDVERGGAINSNKRKFGGFGSVAEMQGAEA
jgi:hypothetical protein